MNPEFQRNLWLNLSSGRLVMMPVVLGAIFLAVAVLPGDKGIIKAAEVLYVLIVVFWGTWLGARAVTGEIRDRTWDNQRMSAISPWSMVWGKLFGSTIYVWYGGAICLAVMAWGYAGQGKPDQIIPNTAYWISVGLFAHAISMLTSLLAIRRLANHVRVQVFLYQLAGLFAAWLAASLWPSRIQGIVIKEVTWFEMVLPANWFFLGSLIAFIIWAVIGNQRLMRQELQFSNSPLYWIGFLLFMMVWAAGWVNSYGELNGLAVLTLRLTVAGWVAAALTYIMVILDTKNPVMLRWVGNRFAAGQVMSATTRMPSWMWSLMAAGVVAVLLLVLPNPLDMASVSGSDNAFGIGSGDIEELYREAGWATGADPRVLIFAAFLFLVRDVFIVLAYNAQGARRGDFAAIITLAVLYLVVPSILVGLDFTGLMSFFFPYPTNPAFLALIPPAVEAGAVAFIFWSRMSKVERPLPAAS